GVLPPVVDGRAPSRAHAARPELAVPDRAISPGNRGDHLERGAALGALEARNPPVGVVGLPLRPARGVTVGLRLRRTHEEEALARPRGIDDLDRDTRSRAERPRQRDAELLAFHLVRRAAAGDAHRGYVQLRRVQRDL